MTGIPAQKTAADDIHRRRAEISVVICAYSQRRWHGLVRAVESVRKQARAAREVIVIIDHNPALHEQARRRWPDVVVVENHFPRGLSGARNTAVARATGDVVAFLDDDAVPDPSWITRITRAYDEAAVIGVGGAVVPAWVDARPRWFPPEFDWVVGCSHSGMPTAPVDVRNLIGANMSLRREAVDSVGGFNASLGRVDRVPSGCEETELCIRIRDKWPHGRIVYDPRIVVRHTIPAERATLRYYLSRCWAEGRSKALLCALVGRSAALSDERRYTRGTLPAGVRRGLVDLVKTADVAGPIRAALIVVGLITTCAGYVEGRVALLRPRNSRRHTLRARSIAANPGNDPS